MSLATDRLRVIYSLSFSLWVVVLPSRSDGSARPNLVDEVRGLAENALVPLPVSRTPKLERLVLESLQDDIQFLTRWIDIGQGLQDDILPRPYAHLKTLDLGDCLAVDLDEFIPLLGLPLLLDIKMTGLYLRDLSGGGRLRIASFGARALSLRYLTLCAWSYGSFLTRFGKLSYFAFSSMASDEIEYVEGTPFLWDGLAPSLQLHKNHLEEMEIDLHLFNDAVKPPADFFHSYSQLTRVTIDQSIANDLFYLPDTLKKLFIIHCGFGHCLMLFEVLEVARGRLRRLSRVEIIISEDSIINEFFLLEEDCGRGKVLSRVKEEEEQLFAYSDITLVIT